NPRSSLPRKNSPDCAAISGPAASAPHYAGGMGDFTTADLFDERGDELQSVSLQLQNLGGRARFTGPIRTVRCHRDNGLVKQLLNSPGEGAVLVVDGGGS